MDQTPLNENHNPDLLTMMPPLRRVVEVGCGSGALAREYKRIHPAASYLGMEVVPEYARLARRYCDEVVVLDIETAGVETLRSLEADGWVFADVLEHLRDPWELLRRIRAAIAPDGHVLACIPNAQHWSVQARLNSGALRYEDTGLLDRTHLRWFTRTTIVELFEQAGFRVATGRMRVLEEPQRESVLAGIEALARATGADVQSARRDAMVYQYLVDAVPA